MFTGDLKPDLVAEISDTQTAVDLTTATSVRIIGKRGTDKVIDRAPTVTLDGDTSLVTMQWQSGDTTAAGRIDFEVEATWPVGKPQTYRIGHVDIAKDYDQITA